MEVGGLRSEGVCAWCLWLGSSGSYRKTAAADVVRRRRCEVAQGINYQQFMSLIKKNCQSSSVVSVLIMRIFSFSLLSLFIPVCLFFLRQLVGFNKRVILTFALFSDILWTRAAQYNFFQHQHCMNNCHGAGCANFKWGKLTQTQVSYFPRLVYKKTFVRCNIIQSNLRVLWYTCVFRFLWITCRFFLHSEPL